MDFSLTFFFCTEKMFFDFLFFKTADMQAFYHRHVLEGSSEPLSQNENPSRSFLPVDGTGAPTSATSDDGVDLEWEHQYDVGPGAVTPTVRSRSRGEVRFQAKLPDGK